MLSAGFFRACGIMLTLSILTLLIGCSSSTKARAVVKGKVTLGDKALTVGNVMFFTKDDVTGSATIDKEGNYVMNDAPIGDVQISVTVPKMPPGGLSKMKSGPAMGAMKDMKSVDPTGSGKSISIMGDMPTHIVPIPAKYENAETSGLTYTVIKGEQTHNLPLAP